MAIHQSNWITSHDRPEQLETSLTCSCPLASHAGWAVLFAHSHHDGNTEEVPRPQKTFSCCDLWEGPSRHGWKPACPFLLCCLLSFLLVLLCLASWFACWFPSCFASYLTAAADGVVVVVVVVVAAAAAAVVVVVVLVVLVVLVVVLVVQVVLVVCNGNGSCSGSISFANRLVWQCEAEAEPEIVSLQLFVKANSRPRFWLPFLSANMAFDNNQRWMQRSVGLEVPILPRLIVDASGRLIG